HRTHRLRADRADALRTLTWIVHGTDRLRENTFCYSTRLEPEKLASKTGQISEIPNQPPSRQPLRLGRSKRIRTNGNALGGERPRAEPTPARQIGPARAPS